jgi:hypothetical protein
LNNFTAEKCHFAVLRISTFEKYPRDRYSTVSTNCSEELMRQETTTR